MSTMFGSRPFLHSNPTGRNSILRKPFVTADVVCPMFSQHRHPVVLVVPHPKKMRDHLPR